MFLIFGLGDGKMDLQLKNVNVGPGDTLEGTASLTMNKDVMGKEVVAVLYAEETVREREANGREISKQVTLYSKSEILDTEKLYTNGNAHINTSSPLSYHKPVQAQRIPLVSRLE